MIDNPWIMLQHAQGAEKPRLGGQDAVAFSKWCRIALLSITSQRAATKHGQIASGETPPREAWTVAIEAEAAEAGAAR